MRRALLALGVLVVAGCSNIAAPALVSVYQYGLANGTDTLYFHWPRSRLPVRIWVADTSTLKPYVATAIKRWESVFLFGEYSAVMVTDSLHADVIFLDAEGSLLRSTPGLNAFAGQCTGLTDSPNTATHVYELPIHTRIAANVIDNNPQLLKCFSITVTHELGHSLGILAHSPISTDVMFSNPLVDSISTNDRETALTAYHVPANVVPGPRP
jgi:predicted Zn-dependent protease